MMTAVTAYGAANRNPYCTGLKFFDFKPSVKKVMQP